MPAKTIYRYPLAELKKESLQGLGSEYGDRLSWPRDWYVLADYTLTSPFHSRCLQIKATCSVGIGWTILDVSESQSETIAQQFKKINPEQSFQEVISQAALDFESFGNAYLEIVRDNAGKVAEIYHLPALLTWIRPQKAGFLYENETTQINYPAFVSGGKDKHSVLHLRQYSPLDRHYGLPDWLGAIPSLDLDYYAGQYNNKFFSNNAIPDMAIIVTGASLDETAEQAIVEFFQTNFKGVDNSHKTLYLPISAPEVTVKFERLSQEIKEHSFERLTNVCRDRVISAHGVPPRLVGISQAGALGGTSEVFGQLSIFQDTIIAPRQVYYGAKVSTVIADMGFLGAAIRFEPLDTTAQETDSDYYSKLVAAGVLTPDEARDELGYRPLIPSESFPAKEEEVGKAHRAGLAKTLKIVRELL